MAAESGRDQLLHSELFNQTPSNPLSTPNGGTSSLKSFRLWRPRIDGWDYQAIGVVIFVAVPNGLRAL